MFLSALGEHIWKTWLAMYVLQLKLAIVEINVVK